MSACAYCLARRGHQTDHLISKAQSRRSIAAARERENPRFKVPACRECNEAKGTRLRVPESHAHLISELETLTGGVYATFSGDPADLREVIR